MKYKPLLIGTMNRHLHFKRAIESLKKNVLAKETDLYIALDFPLKEEHEVGYKKNLEYLNALKGFKSVELIIRTKNLGSRDNFDSARLELFKKYDSIIITEDDNFFSKDFLYFINKGLEVFKDREDIFSICGYSYPTKNPFSDNDFFAYDGFSAWGYGIWKDKFLNVNWDPDFVRKSMESKKITKKIIANHLRSDLENIAYSGIATKDTQICLHQIVNNMYSIFPTVSRVRNYGNDGSGLHSTSDLEELYNTQQIYDGDSDYELDKYLKIDLEVIKRVSFTLNNKNYLKFFKKPHLIIPTISRKLKRILR